MTARADSILIGDSSASSAVEERRDKTEGWSGKEEVMRSMFSGQFTRSRRAREMDVNCSWGWVEVVVHSLGRISGSSEEPIEGLFAAGMARFLRKLRAAWVSWRGGTVPAG